MLRRDVGINVHTNTWDRWKPTTTQSWFNKLKEFDRSNLGVWYLAEYFLILLTPLILHYRNDIHRSQVIRGFCYWNIYWHPIKVWENSEWWSRLQIVTPVLMQPDELVPLRVDAVTVVWHNPWPKLNGWVLLSLWQPDIWQSLKKWLYCWTFNWFQLLAGQNCFLHDTSV